MSQVALALRFLVAELGALVALAWWGWTVHPLLGIALPAVVITLWALFVAPKSPRRLADPARIALELVIFAAATVALVALGQPLLAAAFAVVALATAAAVRVWPEPVAPAARTP